MTADEVLTRYEDAWRFMDLARVPQFYGGAAGGISGGDWGDARCAWVGRPGDEELSHAATRIQANWRCTEPDCDWTSGSMANAIIHINNAHHWTFGEFSKRFRDAWQKGVR